MGRTWFVGILLFGIVVAAGGPRAAGPSATLTLRNPSGLARAGETVVLSAGDLRTRLGVDDVRKVQVRDDRAGRDLLTQAIDLDDDGAWDEVVFQVDAAANETRTLTLTSGERRIPRREDFKVYGRFVRERRDDFAWENDRVAHRMYGAALETWVQEPLTSSGVDVWVKRTPRLVINDWYLVDDYHRDTGEGADLYSVGRTRGCGGNAPWVGGRMAPSPNFRHSRVLANGPIRLMFELSYGPWDANGLTLSEVKRITLDAGQQMNRFESTYTIHASPRDLQYAVGIRKNPGSAMTSSREKGILRTWEPLRDTGSLACGIVIDPAVVTDVVEADGNFAFVARAVASGGYYAGSAWDRGGHVPDMAAWDRYLDEFTQRVARPLEVRFSTASELQER